MYDEQHEQNEPQQDDPTERGMLTEEENSGEKFVNLAKDMEESYKNLEWARKLNENMVREYAGPNYGTTTVNPTKYVNKMQQAVDAYTITLAANRPQVLIDTDHQELAGFAKHFESALNNFIKEIKIEDLIRRWVLDAFLCVGVVKAHMADSGQLQFIRWPRTGRSLPILGRVDRPVAVKSAVKRDKSAVQCLTEHTDLNLFSVVPLA